MTEETKVITTPEGKIIEIPIDKTITQKWNKDWILLATKYASHLMSPTTQINTGLNSIRGEMSEFIQEHVRKLYDENNKETKHNYMDKYRKRKFKKYSTVYRMLRICDKMMNKYNS
jgi:hypothetical protein